MKTRIEWVQSAFNALPTSRKIGLVGGLVVISCATASLIAWLLSPTYGLLFRQIEQQDARRMMAKLDQQHIAYQLRNQGHDIWIDQRLVDKTRIQLLESDTTQNSSIGFELFDKTDFGMTDFSQKINYQRALQGELERTINGLDEVDRVRVQLSIPERRLFEQDENPPRAAITLHLRQPLTHQQIKGIQRLVTASVPHLTPRHVVMVDQRGNPLTVDEDSSANAQLTHKKNIERYLTDKVMQLLRPIFPDDNLVVKIDAAFNYDELTRERSQPQPNEWVTHERRHSIAHKAQKNTTNQDVTRETTYERGHETEQFKRANGTIERLTISVVLPSNTSNEKKIQITRLVQSVVGFNPTRGDVINVEALSAPPIAVESQSTQPLKPIVINKHHPFHLINAMLLIGLASTMVIWTFRRQKQRLNRQRLLTELHQWLLEHESHDGF